MHTLRLFAGFILGCFFAVAALVTLQYLVDPYDYLHLRTLPGVNAQKPYMYENARLTKPQAISREKPRGLILGGSTVEGGFDPTHPALERYRPVYNAALPSGRLYESYRILQHALARSDIDIAIVSLDFINWIGFSRIKASVFDEQEMAVAFDGTPNVLAGSPPSLHHLFNRRVLGNGLVTLSYQDTRVLRNGTTRERFPPHWYLPNGQRTHDSSLRYGIAYGGFDGPFNRFMKAQYDRLKTIDHAAPFPARVAGGDYFDLLEQFVRLSAENDFRLVFVLPPCHITFLETIRKAGVWDEFQQFKRRVVAKVDHADKSQGTRVPVYDFCVFEMPNAEPILSREFQLKPPSSFWDPAHLSDATGDLALTIMLGDLLPEGDFGVDLGKEPDLDAFFARDLERRLSMQKAFPAEFAAIDLALSE
jgi:hypothetical protein